MPLASDIQVQTEYVLEIEDTAGSDTYTAYEGHTLNATPTWNRGSEDFYVGGSDNSRYYQQAVYDVAIVVTVLATDVAGQLYRKLRDMYDNKTKLGVQFYTPNKVSGTTLYSGDFGVVDEWAEEHDASSNAVRTVEVTLKSFGAVTRSTYTT